MLVWSHFVIDALVIIDVVLGIEGVDVNLAETIHVCIFTHFVTPFFNNLFHEEKKSQILNDDKINMIITQRSIIHLVFCFDFEW